MPATEVMMIEGHEDRIQSLEGSMQQVVASTAATAAKVDVLVDTIKNAISKIEGQFSKLDLQIKSHEDKIEELEREAKDQAKRWAAVKSTIVPLLTAGAGVVATKFGESLWSWIKAMF